MRLVEEFERRLAGEQSPFQAQLLREDIVRLGKLQALARSELDPGAFENAAMHIGWTQGDLRTHEIREPLAALLARVYEYERGARNDEQEARIDAAWVVVHRARMERLVGCLSTPVPGPAD